MNKFTHILLNGGELTPEQISEENKEAYLRESELMTEYFLQKYGIRE